MMRYDFSMGLAAHKLKEYYRGNVRHVVLTTDEGLRLQLPLDVFRPHLTQLGIYGVFIVYGNEHH
jgi:hypothetical protein